MRYRAIRFGLLAVLAAMSAAGCGTRRSAISPAAGLDSLPQLATEPLRKGDLVELELADGSRVIGKVDGFQPGYLLLRASRTNRAPASLFGAKETRRIPLEEIRSGARLSGGPPPDLLTILSLCLVVPGTVLLLTGAF